MLASFRALCCVVASFRAPCCVVPPGAPQDGHDFAVPLQRLRYCRTVFANTKQKRVFVLGNKMSAMFLNDCDVCFTRSFTSRRRHICDTLTSQRLKAEEKKNPKAKRKLGDEPVISRVNKGAQSAVAVSLKRLTCFCCLKDQKMTAAQRRARAPAAAL